MIGLVSSLHGPPGEIDDRMMFHFKLNSKTFFVGILYNQPYNNNYDCYIGLKSGVSTDETDSSMNIITNKKNEDDCRIVKIYRFGCNGFCFDNKDGRVRFIGNKSFDNALIIFKVKCKGGNLDISDKARAWWTYCDSGATTSLDLFIDNIR